MNAGARPGAGAVPPTDLIPSFLGYVKTTIWLKLVVCLIIDFLGIATYFLPGIGEILDTGWAPVQLWPLVQVEYTNTDVEVCRSGNIRTTLRVMCV